MAEQPQIAETSALAKLRERYLATVADPAWARYFESEYLGTFVPDPDSPPGFGACGTVIEEPRRRRSWRPEDAIGW